MGLMSQSGSLQDILGALLKAPLHVGATVEQSLVRWLPLDLLAMRLPKSFRWVNEYRNARLALMGNGGTISLRVYEEARKNLHKLAAQADAPLRDAVRKELAAWDHYLGSRAALAEVAVAAPAGGLRQLSREDLAVLHDLNQHILSLDDLDADQVRAVWRQYVGVVGPQHEAAWAELMAMTRSIADRLRGPLAEHGTGFRKWIDDAQTGNLSRIQGLAFELYGRRSLVLRGEVDRLLRLAAAKAARLGRGSEAVHVNGEMFLALLDGDEVLALAAKGSGEILPRAGWKQFADDGVMVVTAGKPGALAEFVPTALVDFKAEADMSRLPEKLESFLARQNAAARGKTAVARYKGVDGNWVQGLLQPPSSDDALTYIGMATSNVHVPMNQALAARGVTQRNIVADISRDELAELVDMLLGAALWARP